MPLEGMIGEHVTQRLRVKGAFVLLCCCVLSTLAPAQAGDANPHVLAGARAFRAGDWAVALVEFRVALKLGAPASVRWYEGATLARSGRFEEAVGVFELAFETAPNAGPPQGERNKVLF